MNNSNINNKIDKIQKSNGVKNLKYGIMISLALLGTQPSLGGGSNISNIKHKRGANVTVNDNLSSHNFIINQNISELSESEVEIHILIEVNKYRSKAGLKSLILDRSLCDVAKRHTEYMSNDHYEHIDNKLMDGSDRIKASPYNSDGNILCAGENIAYGERTIKRLMDRWMGSAGHRKNILNKDFTDMGISYKKGKYTASNGIVHEGYYFTQTFGAKRK